MSSNHINHEPTETHISDLRFGHFLRMAAKEIKLMGHVIFKIRVFLKWGSDFSLLSQFLRLNTRKKLRKKGKCWKYRVFPENDHFNPLNVNGFLKIFFHINKIKIFLDFSRNQTRLMLNFFWQIFKRKLKCLFFFDKLTTRNN